MLREYFLLLCLSCFPFLCSLNGDFVFDDSEAILNNKDVTTEAWINTFYNDFWGTNIKSNLSHKSYRPLTTLSFRLNYITSGKTLNAFHFKITNLLFHVVCCFILLFVYQIIVRRIGHCNEKYPFNISFFAAMLFAVHPIHVEAISGIVGRADILATITFLLSFICYDKSINIIKYSNVFLLLSIILAGIAMLFKENGITVLGFSIVYDIFLQYDKFRKDKSLTKNVCYLVNKDIVIRMGIIILAAITLLYARWLIMGEIKPGFKPTDNPAAFASNLFIKVATFNYIYFMNFLLLIWPKWLCYDWSMGCLPVIESIVDDRIICIICIHLYGILHIKAILQPCRRTNRKLSGLAGLMLIIPFLPASNILFPVGFVIAERILYLPSAGYCFLVSIGLRKLCCKLKRKTHKVVVGMYMALILIYSLKSWERAFDWQNEYKLFISGLSVCPLNAKVHYNVAKVADGQNNLTWALSEYREAIRLHPGYYQAMNNLANLLKNQKEFNEAELYLRKALSIKDDFPAAWMNLGIVLANTKRYDESQHAYNTALRYRHKYPDCLYNLGNLYLAINNTKLAAESWIAAIKLNPKHIYAWTNLIAMLDNTGQTEKALEIIPEALAELPNVPSLLFAVANIFGKINRFKEAEDYFKMAIKLFGKEVKAIHYVNLGVLYHRWKKYDLATDMYQHALVIDPFFKSAKKNLALLYK